LPAKDATVLNQAVPNQVLLEAEVVNSFQKKRESNQTFSFSIKLLISILTLFIFHFLFIILIYKLKYLKHYLFKVII